MDPYDLRCGDCREVMATMGAESIDAIVTDPPYGLSFMGREWDHGVPGVPFWAEALRVAKPGAHLVAFGGSRTFHRLVCAVEDAGWEIRDVLMWLYGSGFPKSLDVSKAIDTHERGAMVREKLMHFAKVRGVDGRWLQDHGVASAASFNDWTVGGHVPGEKNWALVKAALGVTQDEETSFERSVVGRSHGGIAGGTGRHAGSDGAYGFKAEFDRTSAATDAARQWSGWGTALKPAYEPIILARKPLRGTVASNVQAFGTGALNVDGCRVGTSKNVPASAGTVGNAIYGRGIGAASSGATGTGFDPNVGRWPANILLDEEAAALLDEASGELVSNSTGTGEGLRSVGFGRGADGAKIGARPTDRGGASRFFYTAKASAEDRGRWQGNDHPTVKPTDLMRWLCRLVTAPGGLILDPFMGSGSTGCAAVAEGFRFVGVDLDQRHVDIARRRLEHATRQPSLF